MVKKISHLLGALLLSFLFFNSHMAEAKDTLINMPGPKPNVAKSFKAIGKDKYEFTIDKTKKFKANRVRNAIKRNRKYYGKSKIIKDVKSKGDKITITYNGDTNKFLNAIADIDVKGSTGINVASTVSDGGIRAKQAVRSPKENEIMAKVSNPNLILKNVKDKVFMEVMVLRTGQSKSLKNIKKYQKLVVDPKGFKAGKNNTVYFELGDNRGGYWNASNFTLN